MIDEGDPPPDVVMSETRSSSQMETGPEAACSGGASDDYALEMVEVDT